MPSPDWRDGVRAAEALATDQSPQAIELLRRLLDHPDLAVVRAAATALLRHGPAGWTAALEALWHNQEDGRAAQFREAFLDLMIAGEDVETALAAMVDDPPTPAAGRGAREMLMHLDLRPVEYIPDENGE